METTKGNGPGRRIKKKRGGQPGNLNALKHGFYSSTFQEGESEGLDAEIAQGLQDEITMLRVITRRVLKLAQGTEDLDEAMHLLNTMGMAAIRLASLLRIQKMLGGDSDKLGFAITEALSGLIEDMRREKMHARTA